MAHKTIPSGAMEYIRWYYHVPAKRGVRVRYDGVVYRITSATRTALLRCVEEGGEARISLHPTAGVEYLTETCPECRGSGVIE
ncbi:MAG: hypothetical protein WC657_07080, partial [Candidatus Paceibacterota bacterium]